MKAIFCDIDGVVIHDPGHLHLPEQISFLPKAIISLKKVQEAGFFLAFISNKGGAFAKKNLDLKGLEAIDKSYISTLKKEGLDGENLATYYCSHYPPGDCECRKPKEGMFKQAISDHHINIEESYAIGDKVSDLQPAIGLGCKLGVLVKRNTEFFDIDKEKNEANGQYIMLDSLSHAISYILNKNE